MISGSAPLLLGALLLLGAAPGPGALEVPAGRETAIDSIDPRVRTFVDRADPRAEIEVAFRDAERGVVLFRAHSLAGDGRQGWSRAGIRYGHRVGWIASDSAPAGPRVFRVPADDRYFRSPRFARASRESGIGWDHPFGPALARDPRTPLATLRFAATDRALHPLLVRNPRVRDDLATLALLRGGGAVSADLWREAALPALARAANDRRATLGQLHLVLDAIDSGPPRPRLAAGVARTAAARGDSSLLLAAARLRERAYSTARRAAIGALLRMPAPPQGLWLTAPWWETHPQAIDDPRIRHRRDVLLRLRAAADPFRHAALRAEADHRLLADPGLDSSTVLEITLDAAANLGRCRPRPYPVRDVLHAALNHPRAGEDLRIPQSLSHLRELPDVRTRAYRMATGRTPARGARQSAGSYELARLRGAHQFALSRIEQTGVAWADSARAVLDGWERRGLHRAEVAAWRDVLTEYPDQARIARALARRTPETEHLLTVSPLLALIPPAELDPLGVGCEFVPPPG